MLTAETTITAPLVRENRSTQYAASISGCSNSSVSKFMPRVEAAGYPVDACCRLAAG